MIQVINLSAVYVSVFIWKPSNCRAKTVGVIFASSSSPEQSSRRTSWDRPGGEHTAYSYTGGRRVLFNRRFIMCFMPLLSKNYLAV